MLCLPEGALELDPAPRETMRRDVELVFSWDGTPTGVVGWAEAA